MKKTFASWEEEINRIIIACISGDGEKIWMRLESTLQMINLKPEDIGLNKEDLSLACSDLKKVDLRVAQKSAMSLRRAVTALRDETDFRNTQKETTKNLVKIIVRIFTTRHKMSEPMIKSLLRVATICGGINDELRENLEALIAA